MLKLDVKVGETIMVGAVTLKLEHKSGQLARFSIVNPEGTTIETSKRAATQVPTPS